MTHPFVPLSEAKPPLLVGAVLRGADLDVGLVDDLGRPLWRLAVPTQSGRGPEAAAEQLGAAVRRAIEETHVEPAAIARLGFALPGIIDNAAGTLVEAIRLRDWQQFPLRERISHFCRLPVTLANDADAAAYGEFWVGSGRPLRSMVLLTLGPGVGSGVILGAQPINGRHVQSSECGHMIICSDEDARVCGCGQRGHLEAYASATAVVARTAEALRAGRGSSLAARLIAGAPLTADLVTAEAAGGDPLALEIVMDTARYLAVGIVSLLHTVDPSGVLLGGEMTFGGAASELGGRFLARVREEVGRRAFPVLAERTTIEPAGLGSDAAVLGAAGLARLESQAG